MLWGGDFTAPNGTIVHLDNAFKMAFTAPHLKSAREKCGYCPCTRQSLYDPKVRREMGDEDIDSSFTIPADNDELDMMIRKLSLDNLRENPNDRADGVNAYDRLLKNIEAMNHNAVETLCDAGYSKAKDCKSSVKEKEDDPFSSSRDNVTTRPNTRERQELLATSKRRAGTFFRITRGGAMLNTTDMLIAIEMNRMKDKAKKLQKVKDDCLYRAELLESVEDIMDCGGPRRLYQYKKCIEWKSKKKPGQKKLAALKAEWENKYAKADEPPVVIWTTKKEARLQRLERGDIDNIFDNSLFKHARATKCSFLRKQLNLVDLKSQVQLMTDAYQSFPEEFRSLMKRMMDLIDDGKEFNATCFDYDSADEDLDSDSDNDDGGGGDGDGDSDNESSDDDIARPDDNNDNDDAEIANADTAGISHARNNAEIAKANDAEAADVEDNDYDSEPSFDSKLLEDDDDSEDDDSEDDSEDDNSIANIDAELSYVNKDGESSPICESNSLESDEGDDAANVSFNNQEDEATDDLDDPIEQEQSATKVSYEGLDREKLIELCRSRGIKNVSRRWKESTLIAKLVESDRQE